MSMLNKIYTNAKPICHATLAGLAAYEGCKNLSLAKRLFNKENLIWTKSSAEKTSQPLSKSEQGCLFTAYEKDGSETITFSILNKLPGNFTLKDEKGVFLEGKPLLTLFLTTIGALLLLFSLHQGLKTVSLLCNPEQTTIANKHF